MKTTIYEIALYPNGGIIADLQIWHLTSKEKMGNIEKPKKKEVKRLYLRLEKAA